MTKIMRTMLSSHRAPQDSISREKWVWFSKRAVLAARECRLYLDSRIPQHLKSGPHISLQLVLHPSEAQELHLPLQAFHHCSDFQGPVMDAQFGLTVSVLRTEGTGTQPCPHFMCMTHTTVLYQLWGPRGQVNMCVNVLCVEWMRSWGQR